MSVISIEKLLIKHNDNTLVDLMSLVGKNLDINSSLAFVGQSGSGKSLTIKSILGLLPQELKSEFIYKSEFDLNFKNLGFIPQNPFTSLSPMTKINKQFFTDEKNIDKYMHLVGLDKNLKYRFPMQLSGGQLQRVIIAITLCRNPKLLLLDEPTTALDETSKDLILNLLKELQSKLNFKMIFVSHDIDSIKDVCEDIAIINQGKICELGKTKEVLENPKEEYTKNLLNSNFKNREFRV